MRNRTIAIYGIAPLLLGALTLELLSVLAASVLATGNTSPEAAPPDQKIPPGQLVRKTISGPVVAAADDLSSITVGTKFGNLLVNLTSETVVHAPPDKDVGLGAITVGSKIVVKLNRPPLDKQEFEDEEPLPLSTGDEEPPPLSTGDEEPPPLSTGDQEPPPLSTGDEEPPPLSTGDEEPPPLSTGDEEPPPLSTGDEEPPPLSTVDEEPPPSSITEEVPPFRTVTAQLIIVRPNKATRFPQAGRRQTPDN